VGKTLGEELNRTNAVIVPKLRVEQEESANSLKAALEVAEACREKMRLNDRIVREELEALKAAFARVDAERDQLLKEKVDAEERERTLNVEMEKCQEFMIRIKEESFYQGVRQVAFFHGVSTDDPRYDLGKDVVNGNLVPLGENAHNVMEEEPQRIEVVDARAFSRRDSRIAKNLDPGCGL